MSLFKSFGSKKKPGSGGSSMSQEQISNRMQAQAAKARAKANLENELENTIKEMTAPCMLYAVLLIRMLIL